MLKRLFSERPLRLPHLRPYVPRPTDPAIYWFNSERDDIIRDVVHRVTSAHSTNRKMLEVSLNDAAYHEVRRLEAQDDDEARQSLGYWRSMIRRIAKMSETEMERALESIVTRMGQDVAGNFDPRVYGFAKHILPRMVTGLMQPSLLRHNLMAPPERVLEELLEVEGDVEHLRTLQAKGSLVYVPTHSSNMDSIVLGQALEMSGLAPAVYGAGKNLFTNPIISFFMHNLGAYRVDRRVRVQLYKEVLKEYSQVIIERGYHSLFFPGGTRSRSGMIERQLKLGLLGSAVEAFTQNQMRRVKRPVWFVPTTINYALVLEAETLVNDWLTEEGKARYIIEDDEFSRIDRWVSFFRKVLSLQGACVIRFGKPLDPFGNQVDPEGRSLSPTGRVIDPGSYVTHNGKPKVDPVRDAAYTRELGNVLAERYCKDTVLMGTQFVAHILFRHFVAATPGVDLFSRLRLRNEISFDTETVLKSLGEGRDKLIDAEQAGAVNLSPTLRAMQPAGLLDRALTLWNGYHSHPTAEIVNGEVMIGDPTLLLYYQNRMLPFAQRIAGPNEEAATREICMLGLRR